MDNFLLPQKPKPHSLSIEMQRIHWQAVRKQHTEVSIIFRLNFSATVSWAVELSCTARNGSYAHSNKFYAFNTSLAELADPFYR